MPKLSNDQRMQLLATYQAVTIENCLTADHFVHTQLTNADGTPLRARRTGKTQTWKTRPNEFKIPFKYGLYYSGYITHNNATDWKVDGILSAF